MDVDLDKFRNNYEQKMNNDEFRLGLDQSSLAGFKIKTLILALIMITLKVKWS